MSPLEIAGIVFGCVAACGAGGGATVAFGDKHNWDWEDPGPVCAVALWPLVLPGLVMHSVITGARDAWKRRRSALPEARVVK